MLPQRTHVTLGVLNTLGQQIATLVDAMEGPGEHVARFDGSSLARGLYFYRLRAGDYVATKKALVVK